MKITDSNVSESTEKLKSERKSLVNVGFQPSSGAGMRTVSLLWLAAITRFSSFFTSWAGPRVPLALSLLAVRWQVLRGPASREEERGEILPFPESPAADEGGSTKTSLTGCVPPTVVARGGEVLPFTLEQLRVSIPADT